MLRKYRDIYDERESMILESLQKGYTREQLEALLDLKWKSVDIFMRRRGYRWDREQQTFVQKSEQTETQVEVAQNIPQNALQIIKYFDENQNVDPKQIAMEKGFKNHRELAIYMEKIGFIWDGDKQNYIYSAVPKQRELQHIKEEIKKVNLLEQKHTYNQELAMYMPLLNEIHKNTERLFHLLKSYEETNQLGVPFSKNVVEKNIRLPKALSAQLSEFSQKHAISENQVIEAAIVDFFRLYQEKETESI